MAGLQVNHSYSVCILIILNLFLFSSCLDSWTEDCIVYTSPNLSVCKQNAQSFGFHPLSWSSLRWCLDVGMEEEVVWLSWNVGRKGTGCLDSAVPSTARQWFISGVPGAEQGPLGTLCFYPWVFSMNLASHIHVEVNSPEFYTGSTVEEICLQYPLLQKSRLEREGFTPFIFLSDCIFL